MVWSDPLHAKHRAVSMEKLHFYLPALAGKEIHDPDSGKRYTVGTCRGRSGQFTLFHTEGNLLKPAEVIFQWFFHFHSKEKADGCREADMEAREFIFAVVKRCETFKVEKKNAKRTYLKEMATKKRLQKLLEKAEVEEASRGEQLHVDNYNAESIQRKLISCEERLQLAEAQRNDVVERSSSAFSFVQDVVDFFYENFAIRLTKSGLSRWDCKNKDSAPAIRGHRFKIPQVAEEALLETVLYCDSMGFPFDRHRIMELVEQMGGSKASKTWFNNWFVRMQRTEPRLVQVVARASDLSTNKFFTTNNVNWWFDCFKEAILKYKFAKPSNEPDQEVEWLTPARVFNFDETCTSGGMTRRGLAYGRKRKVITLTDRVDPNCGKRRAPQPKETDEHHTLVGGANLLGQRLPASWILSAKTDIRSDQRKEAMRVGAVETIINNQRIKRCFVNTSENGGITLHNIGGILLEIINEVYPDVADRDGSRVLVLCDWHSSRFNKDMLEAFAKTGVVMIGFLPNCTSKMQPMDVGCFGYFKAKRDKFEHRWKLDNPGESVNRMAKIEIAARAYKELGPETILKSFELTGINPLNRQVLLNLPCVQTQGDTLEQASRQCFGSSILRLISESSPSKESGPITSVLDQPPRLGPERTLEDQSDITLGSLAAYRSELIEDIEEMAKTFQAKKDTLDSVIMPEIRQEQEDIKRKLDSDISNIMEDIANKQREASKAMQELENVPLSKRRRLDNIMGNLDGFKDMIKHFDFNTPDGMNEGRCAIARLRGQLNDIAQAKLDKYGLPVDVDDPTIPISFSDPPPGISFSPLKRTVRRCSTAIVRGPTSKTNDIGPKNITGRIIAGEFLYDVGTPVATSKKAIARISEAYKVSATKAKTKADKAQVAAEKEAEKRRTINDRLAASTTKLQANVASGKGRSATSMREWVALVMEYARYNKNDKLVTEAKKVHALKGGDFSESVDKLFQLLVPRQNP